jgi:uncharacterized protein (DUF1697 family)
MDVRIALLRGVNLGAAKRVAMADLRQVFESLGHTGVCTLLQSGNLVFGSGPEREEALEAEAERALLDQLGLRTEVFVRGVGAWREMIEANPFIAEAERDPAHLVVVVLRRAPAEAAQEALEAAISGRERARIVGRTAYIVYPDGIGDSRFTGGILDRALGVRGTGRNWNTVLKLANLAGA